MTRYVSAALAGLMFTFTGHPSGLRLICGIAACNLVLTIWAHVRPEVEG